MKKKNIISYVGRYRSQCSQQVLAEHAISSVYFLKMVEIIIHFSGGIIFSGPAECESAYGKLVGIGPTSKSKLPYYHQLEVH